MKRETSSYGTKQLENSCHVDFESQSNLEPTVGDYVSIYWSQDEKFYPDHVHAVLEDGQWIFTTMTVM